MEGTLTRYDMLPVARKEVKDAVIQVLTKTWPLNARNIYLEVKKNHQSTITYQGVHKAIRQLKDQQIINEQRRQYSLNPDWISNLKTFANKAESKYQNRQELDFSEVTGENAKTYEFNTYAEALYAILAEVVRDRKNNKEPDIAVSHVLHPWLSCCIAKEHYDQLKFALGTGTQYQLIRNDTFTARFLAKFLGAMNVQIKLGVPCALHCDVMVIRDKVIQMYMPTGLKKYLDELFTAREFTPELLIGIYHGDFESFGKIRMVLTKNKEVADQIRAETLEYFKEEKR